MCYSHGLGGQTKATIDNHIQGNNNRTKPNPSPLMGSGYIVLSRGGGIVHRPIGAGQANTQGEMHMSKQHESSTSTMIMNSEGSVSAEGAEIRGDLYLSCDEQCRFGVYVPPEKGSPACMGPARKFDPQTDTLRIPLFVDATGTTGLIGFNAPAVIVSSAKEQSALGWTKRPESGYLVQAPTTDGGKAGRGVWPFYVKLSDETLANLECYRTAGHSHGGLFSLKYSIDPVLAKYKPDQLSIMSEEDRNFLADELHTSIKKAEAA